jgi:hypothetical protein
MTLGQRLRPIVAGGKGLSVRRPSNLHETSVERGTPKRKRGPARDPIQASGLQKLVSKPQTPPAKRLIPRHSFMLSGVGAYFGRSTLSITWITPFEAMISAVVTRDVLTFTPLRPSM